LQARLLGLSGLLPSELNGRAPAANEYLRRIWDLWWRERDELADCTLPRQLWRFHGLRPANHPQRRLALAAHWLHRGTVVERVEAWCAGNLADRALLPALVKIFEADSDDFWSRHWTFRSAALAKPQPLLGEPRVTDLAVNVVLPWLWARARAGANEKLRATIEHRFEVWPAAEDNAVLRLARQRLLGKTTARAARLATAARQQGLLQIVRDFCDHADSACGGCGFPELVRHWSVQRPPAPSVTALRTDCY
jgi:hypothetical protein